MRVKLILKSKDNGELQDIYPPVSHPQNGLIEWPVELDKWEVLSVHGCTGIELHNFWGNKRLVFEGDELYIVSLKTSNHYEVKFKDGVYGIYVHVTDLSELFFGSAFKNGNVEEFYRKEKPDDKNMIFIPLYHLNLGGKLNETGEEIVTLK